MGGLFLRWRVSFLSGRRERRWRGIYFNGGEVPKKLSKDGGVPHDPPPDYGKPFPRPTLVN